MTKVEPTGSPVEKPASMARLREAFARWTEPAQSNLPRWPVLLWFPAAATAGFLVLVVWGLTGSSTGVFWAALGQGPDPRLIAGVPRDIRIDEWLNQTSWIVSQASQGFPAVNHTFPGGMDATVLSNLPNTDWSNYFRPHLLASLVLPLDQGIAWRWWMPGLALVVGCYVFAVSLIPRRPVTAALLSIALFFMPIIQWWWHPDTLWPPAWSLLTLAALVWCLRDRRLWVRIVWSAIVGYLAVCTAMGGYLPYIVPLLHVILWVGLGIIVEQARRSALGIKVVLARLVPLLVAGALAAVVLAAWLLTRSAVIHAVLSTVYPGQRLEPTGTAGLHEMVSLFAAPFDEALTANIPGGLGINSSEASTPVLIGVFLMIPLAWLVFDQWHRTRSIDWPAVGCLWCAVLFFAFMLVPGWNVVAHLLLLDRSLVTRLRLGLGVLSVVAIVLLVRHIDRRAGEISAWVAWVASAAAATSVVVVWAELRSSQDPALAASKDHWVLAALFVASVFLFARGRALLGAIGFVIVSVLLTVTVNPIYRGVFDLRSTSVGLAVERTNSSHPGTWVGVGGHLTNAVLVETGVSALNGAQPYPPALMWEEIDPSGTFASQWNRLATVSWVPGSGPPVVSNPAPDQIQVTFDSCSAFAQQSVTYVLADAPLQQSCLTQLSEPTQGASIFYLYSIKS